MTQEIRLSEEDMLVLQKCLNDGVEPPQEIAKKLSPIPLCLYLQPFALCL